MSAVPAMPDFDSWWDNHKPDTTDAYALAEAAFAYARATLQAQPAGHGCVYRAEPLRSGDTNGPQTATCMTCGQPPRVLGAYQTDGFRSMADNIESGTCGHGRISAGAQPAEVPDAEIERIAIESEMVFRSGGKLLTPFLEHIDLTRNVHAFARAILAPRPQAMPMTVDQAWHSDTLMAANGIAGFKMDALMRIVRAVEAHHGITAPAGGEGRA